MAAHVECPHCQSPIAIARDSATTEIVCGLCNGRFELRGGQPAPALVRGETADDERVGGQPEADDERGAQRRALVAPSCGAEGCRSMVAGKQRRMRGTSLAHGVAGSAYIRRMSGPLPLSLCVITRDAAAQLADCLASLREQDYPAFRQSPLRTASAIA